MADQAVRALTAPPAPRASSKCPWLQGLRHALPSVRESLPPTPRRLSANVTCPAHPGVGGPAPGAVSVGQALCRTFSGCAIASSVELICFTMLRFVGSGTMSASVGLTVHALTPACNRGPRGVEAWTEETWEDLEYSEENVC